MKKKIYIYSFYRFKDLERTKYVKESLENISRNKFIYGTILIAKEGINGTISGTKSDLNEFIDYVKKLIKIRKLIIKISINKFVPFYRLKIKLKKEIVTIGYKSIKNSKLNRNHITPKKWDKIIQNNKYTIIDTRNDYEIKIGTFKNSINPKIKSFREFPNYIKENKIKKDQPIAMFCTGGIRCEKASSYLLSEGYKNVYQLDGGILNYLEYKKNKKINLWNGECFVFDNRVSLNKNLQKGSFDQCFGCRYPISRKDMQLKSYVKGVSCKNCIDKKTTKKIKSSKTRQAQIDTANKNGKLHSFSKITT